MDDKHWRNEKPPTIALSHWDPLHTTVLPGISAGIFSWYILRIYVESLNSFSLFSLELSPQTTDFLLVYILYFGSIQNSWPIIHHHGAPHPLHANTIIQYLHVNLDFSTAATHFPIAFPWSGNLNSFSNDTIATYHYTKVEVLENGI